MRDHKVINSFRVERAGHFWRYFYRASAEKSETGREEAAGELSPEEIERAKLKAYERLRLFMGEEVQRFKEIERGTGPVRMQSGPDVVASEMAASEVSKEMTPEQSRGRYREKRELVVGSGASATSFTTSRNFIDPQKRNILVQPPRGESAAYGGLNQATIAAASDLGMTALEFQLAFQHFTQNADIPPQYRGTPKGVKLRSQLSLHLAIMRSEMIRSESAAASLGIGIAGGTRTGPDVQTAAPSTGILEPATSTAPFGPRGSAPGGRLAAAGAIGVAAGSTSGSASLASRDQWIKNTLSHYQENLTAGQRKEASTEETLPDLLVRLVRQSFGI